MTLALAVMMDATKGPGGVSAISVKLGFADIVLWPSPMFGSGMLVVVAGAVIDCDSTDGVKALKRRSEMDSDILKHSGNWSNSSKGLNIQVSYKCEERRNVGRSDQVSSNYQVSMLGHVQGRLVGSRAKKQPWHYLKHAPVTLCAAINPAVALSRFSSATI